MPVELTWKDYELYLLAITLWREARGGDYLEQAGVVHSILNRVKAKSWFGSSISEVIAKPFQYSSMGDPHDKQLTRWPVRGDASFELSCQIVEDVVNQVVQDPTSGATHFHDSSMIANPPSWAKAGELKAHIGRMFFYKAA